MGKSFVLVTGGAGFIGSNVNKLLCEYGYNTIVLDNLSHGTRASVTRGIFVEGDIGDRNCLNHLFSTYPIDTVLHFAASIDVGESVAKPGLYYANNVVNTLVLLQRMLKYRIKQLVFSSTAAVYGIPESNPLTESHTCKPINPYGKSKLMVEEILKDFDQAYGLRYASLRYFNAAGGDPTGEVKNYKMKENNLIPHALRSLKTNSKLSIFGTDYPTKDGTCIRDYVHVFDLARAHILAMEKLQSGAKSATYNLGNSAGHSVREVCKAVEEITGKNLDIMEAERRPGDPPQLISDSNKAKQELGWTIEHPSLSSIVRDAWNSMDHEV